MDPELVSPQIPLQPKLLSRSEILLRRTLLLTAVIILSITSAFLAYQNKQLTKQITMLSKPTSVPSPTPLPPNTFDYCGSSQPKTEFSITPPTGWTITKKNGSEIYQEYRITKDDEWVGLTCGTGFGGGGCPPKNHQILTIASQKVQSCIDSIPNTSKVGLSLSYLDYGGNTFSFSGSVNNKQTLDQILSTFKFIDKETTTYTCPPNGYVDCMPNPNAGVRFECTPEAFTWYKANCPNFQGGAL